MRVNIRGAQEHNLSNVDVEIGDGLTVVTGVSGSGKTSLVFDTLYHEARRRFLDVFGGTTRLAPANVRSITGLGPAVAVGQNLLNRNPASTLATASGLHPFFRLLYARFGKRHCARCGAGLEHWTEDEIVERVTSLVSTESARSDREPWSVVLRVPLLRGVSGSHRTLLGLLKSQFGAAALHVDGQIWDGAALASSRPHDLDVQVAEFAPTRDAGIVSTNGPPTSGPPTNGRNRIGQVRAALHAAWALGANAIQILHANSGVPRHESVVTWSRAPVCASCGTWFADLEPVHFKTPCPACEGQGCARCNGTGLHPQAAAVRWQGLDLPGLLSGSIAETRALFDDTASAGLLDLPSSAGRLREEIKRRLDALHRVGLGYVSLDRPSPTLSRGESQRVRLAVALTSRLEDMLHVLDEPTIGQHPADVANLLPAFRELAGPVVYVEHDRVAAAGADRVIDLGPGAGEAGGRIVFEGAPNELWQADTPTGRYFSLRERVSIPARPELVPGQDVRWLTVQQANLRNLNDVDVSIPIGHLSVITGVSGSGKSTFVEDVLAASLHDGQPVGCRAVLVPDLSMGGNLSDQSRPPLGRGRGSFKCTIVDQSPIGRNPRSNPATYTKLSDVVRDLYASSTGLSASHFSFNRPEGACPTCKGIGATEMRMRYLSSTWIPCADCGGQRFSEEVLAAKVSFAGEPDRAGFELSIADFYGLSIAEVLPLMAADAVAVSTQAAARLSESSRTRAERILGALLDIGLGYLRLGQPSPTLSGGEAQRVKLAKYLGQRSLKSSLLILDEPSTGLHPADVAGLLTVLHRLVRGGATVVVVEHNTDVIRAADWVIDLGPGAGPKGGRVLYAGPPSGLLTEPVEVLDSATGRALREESLLEPGVWVSERATAIDSREALGRPNVRPVIQIRGAGAHNLRDVNVDLPKEALTVVTGVSGSGKSSLVGDVLEVEARRRYLESLSLYERQGMREGPEAPVKSVSGLGVTVTVTPERRLHARRSTVGTVTELGHHLAVLLAWVGERHCTACAVGSPETGAFGEVLMQRVRHGARERWLCPECGTTAPVAQPRHFSPTNYVAACTVCNGVGSLREPNPDKLIVHPEKPLCAGAMHSPGFFPKGYLCKPYNGGYYEVRALATRYEFDPDRTPWNEMSEQARHAFLSGDPEPMTFRYESRTGRTHSRTGMFGGFYRWIGDWDVGGTYTDTLICPGCRGAKLRPEYESVFLRGSISAQGAAMGGSDDRVSQEHSLHSLSTMSLFELHNVLRDLECRLIQGPDSECLEAQTRYADGAPEVVFSSLRTALDRLSFLLKVGLGYLHLDRPASTLSAGEAQRIRLAGLLGSGLVSLTVLLDEPSRGLHPSEVGALVDVLKALRDEGNTVIVVEHDPEVILAADHLLDIGPGPGVAGGEIVAQGTPAAVARQDTTTARWLRGERKFTYRERRIPRDWMTIRGARANNLCDVTVRFPLGALVGLCGVSGSGKSTLLIDTLGRALAPKKQTTSVAYENVDPGEHDAIEGVPRRVILVDQTKKGVRSPANFFGLNKPIHELYAQGLDAQALGLDARELGQHCSACRGSGTTRMDMGFLPDVHTTCEVCRGTGYRPEAWQIHYLGVPLPELFSMTIDQVYDLFQNGGSSESPVPSQSKLVRSLAAAREVGLGYLVLRQPGYSLSGGEAQRLKIAQELRRPTDGGKRTARNRETLYILDEPTLGQHLEDVARLCSVLNRLVDDGHTVLVSEHHPHLLAACDWLVELGPGGGPQGGRILAEGTPERISAQDTPTAPYLAALLGDAQDA